MMLLELLLKATCLIAAAATAHALVARRTSAAGRHALWTLTVIALLMLPIALVVMPGWTTIRVAAPLPAASAPSGPQVFLTSLPHETAPAAGHETAGAVPVSVRVSWMTVVFVAYASIAMLLLCRLLAQHRTAARLVGRTTALADADWTRLLAECAAAVGVPSRVTLLRSAEETMPMALGASRPVILLPASADAWSDDRRRSVLLHELAHVARRDCLTQSLAAAACALYWVHPGVWSIAARLRRERELACDDRVLLAGADAHDYAGHLLEVARAALSPRVPALAVAMAACGQLEARLRALLDAGRRRATPGRRQWAAATAVTLGVVFAIGGARAESRPASADGETLLTIQDLPRESFEVASVKPNKSTETGGFIQRRPGGSFAVGNQTLRTLIGFAYQLQGFQLVDAPDWTANERFDIVAKAGRDLPVTPIGSTSHEALMLRSLLEDRFALRVHRETREMPIYAMVVARSDGRLGPQLRRPANDYCAQRYQALKKGVVVESSPTDPVCGIRGGNNVLTAGAFPLGEFARLLSGQVRRIVIDRTGLTGEWDFELKFSPPDAQPTDPDRPVIFTALEEQLGLRLEATTGPVEVVVVDHVERPTPD